MKESKKESGRYITHALLEHTLNGDAYISEEELAALCRQTQKGLQTPAFRADLAEQLRLGRLAAEEGRIYISRTLRYENYAACHLPAVLNATGLKAVTLPPVERLSDLCQEQKEAAELALSSRLSLVLGGAGCGKTTLIQTIFCYADTLNVVLCAPTGKAARNLADRVGWPARTVHSALGMKPDDDFLDPVQWDHVELVIVDEASMLTLEMLSGLLCKLGRNPTAHLVLLGDPNQLLSVGSGNILPDLAALDAPSYTLRENHRQSGEAKGLLHNVTAFSEMRSFYDLTFDDSFELRELPRSVLKRELVEDAARRYLAGESVQVVSPFNSMTELSVNALNRAIQAKVNPPAKDKPTLTYRGNLLREGDRVIILKNDRNKNCSNGDVGTFHILSDGEGVESFSVTMPDGRTATWYGLYNLVELSLAYALTIHKVQGSEWDTILMPMVDTFGRMLYRNLFYTGISRARRHVVLYGSANAVGVALQREAQPRKSMLVAKTRAA